MFAKVCLTQNDLQKCAEVKNKELEIIINNGKGTDSTALKKFIQLDSEWKECVVGKTIPEFSVQTITGNSINVEKLKGKIVVANFWFTTCPPCIAEIPAFNKLADEYKNESIEFLAFALNDKKKLKKFLKKTPFNFEIIPDSGPLEELFGVLEHPVTFIIDQKSKVKMAWAGGSVDENAKTEVYLKTKPIIDDLLKTE
jgi:peroxiredoxin